MRNGWVYLSLFAWGIGSIAGFEPRAAEVRLETALRWHFAGSKKLAALPDAKVLKEILERPESAALRGTAVSGLALRAASAYSRGDTNLQAKLAGWMEPLILDAWQNESQFELAAEGGKSGWILAVRLPAERLEEWSQNLAHLARETGMQGGGSGPEWAAKRENYSIRFGRSGEWTVVEGGGLAGTVFKKFRASLGKGSENLVLFAEADFAAWGGLGKAAWARHRPKASLTVAPKGAGLRAELQVDYPENLQIQPEKWNVPHQTVREPLIGFTALQGVGKTLREIGPVMQASAGKIPNQVFLWSQGSTPFTVFMAADVGSPTTVISNVAERIVPGLTNLQAGQVRSTTNRPAILWQGLPVVVPFLEPAPDENYLLAGVFPLARLGTNAVPAELLEQLNKKNVIYYEWEITQARLRQWKPLWQLSQMMSGALPNPAAVSEKWIDMLATRLENTVTEGVLENLRQIKVVRQSQAGLNALELALLAHWLDAGDLLPAHRRSPQPALPPGPAPALPALPAPPTR